MTESKYDYLKTNAKDLIRETVYPPFTGMIAHTLKDKGFQIRFTHVSVPFHGKEDPHAHDFDQVFLFVPCHEDLNAYDAESEMYLGEEGDKVTITETTALFVPAGMIHCPIIHKRVGTPFFFVNCPISGEYSAIVDGNKQKFPLRSMNDE